MTLKVACTTTAPKEKLKIFSRKFMHYGNLGAPEYNCQFVRISVHVSRGRLMVSQNSVI